MKKFDVCTHGEIVDKCPLCKDKVKYSRLNDILERKLYDKK